MLDEYVMDGVSDIERSRDEMGHVGIRLVLPCRFSGCTRTFVYAKCRVNHEKKIHDLEVTEEKQGETNDDTKKSELSESKEDNVFNYGCLHLSLGLLLHNADDSVKEGDGERLMRVWKFLTFVFRSH